MATNKRLSPASITEAQHAWLVAEAKRTGSSITALIRVLIQEKIDSTK